MYLSFYPLKNNLRCIQPFIKINLFPLMVKPSLYLVFSQYFRSQRQLIIKKSHHFNVYIAYEILNY